MRGTRTGTRHTVKTRSAATDRRPRLPAWRHTLIPAAVAYLVLLTGATSGVVAQEYPLIQRAGSPDPLFRQQQDSVSQFYRAQRSGGIEPPLMVYRYQPAEGDTLISLASRFSVPYSTLATLNRIEGVQIPGDLDSLLIPSLPGLFVPREVESSLETMIDDRINDELDEHEGRTARISRNGATEEFVFYAGKDFSSDERRAFLSVLFRPPLEEMRLTSAFGFRRNPFTGGTSFHQGIDLGAPPRTPVYAAASGRVASTGRNAIYGRYVLLEHDRGYETFYGHLQTVEVELNERVSSGMMIGTVGSSGLTTGPHLHFEVRLHGRPRDPFQLLPGTSQ